jgi:hypothetical protein
MIYEQASLAVLKSNKDNFIWSKDRIQLYQDERGQFIIPPCFLDLYINRRLATLTKTVPTEAGGLEYALTENGERWTEEAFGAYAFLDKDQRDEFGKACIKKPKSSENKLAFARFIQDLFGKSGPRPVTFLDHLKAKLEDELLRQCKEMDLKKPDGDAPTTIDDVLGIFKSREMISLYESGEKATVYNKMMPFKSITCEGYIGWVEDAIDEYLNSDDVKAAAVMAKPCWGAKGQKDCLRRNSIVKLAVKKSTQTFKQDLQEIEKKCYHSRLVLDEMVHSDPQDKDTSKYETYLERIRSGDWEVVQLDTKFIPKSRQKHPNYWVKLFRDESIPRFNANLCNAVGTGIKLGFSVDKIKAEVVRVYAELTRNGAVPDLPVISTSPSEESPIETEQTNDRQLGNRISSLLESIFFL